MKKIIVAALMSMVALPVFAVPLNMERETEGVVKAHSTITYTQEFIEGFGVEVSLSGECDRYEPNSTNPNLYVYDPQNRLVAKSENPSCFEKLSFIPKINDGKYKIVISNKPTTKKINFTLTVIAEYGEDGEM